MQIINPFYLQYIDKRPANIKANTLSVVSNRPPVSFPLNVALHFFNR